MADQNFTITQEFLHKLFDYKNGNFYWKIKTSPKTIIGNLAGTLDGNGYLQIQINKKTYRSHRLIFLYHHGYLPEFIDHINGIKNDNRIENLRPATKSQNLFNSKLSKINTSGFKGVSWDESHKKWRVRLFINKKSKCFGFYNDIDYAKFIANTMRYKYHQKFANYGGV